MKTDATSSTTDARIADGIVAVREGPSANCSSIGSVIDTLFVTATVGGALFVAVAAAIQREKGSVRVIGETATEPEKSEEPADAPPA